jgi:hypothetical protein
MLDELIRLNYAFDVDYIEVISHMTAIIKYRICFK